MLRLADFTDRGIDSVIEQPLPAPCPCKSLDQGAVGMRLRGRRKLAAIGRDDTLAPAAALEGAWGSADEGAAVERGLDARISLSSAFCPEEGGANPS